MSASRQWLLDAARLAKPSADLSRLELPAALDEAWQQAASHAGVDTRELARHVARLFDLRVADVARPTEAAIARIPEKVARDHQVLPLREEGNRLVVATADPSNHEAASVLAFVAERSIAFEVASPDELALRRTHTYASAESQPQFDLDAPAGGDASPVAKLVDLMLLRALAMGASDIHLQPMMQAAIVRLRVDGVLRRMAVVPAGVMGRMIGRVKAVAGMDVSDRLRPQDGRASVKHGGQVHDLRLSTVPVQGTEKLVMRILSHAAAPSLSRLGFAPPEAEKFRELVTRAQGLVLVTGPTGSGKTTALYGAITERNTPGVNIVTIEDPVEYQLPRVTQMEVNAKTGLTFAAGLRALLRQDPDIVLIGEIRDAETAQIAVQAANTGHLVLATLHTNDAVAVLPRLQDLGVSLTLLAEALAGATSQRLVRRVCASCGTSETTPASEQEAWLQEHAAVPRFARAAAGCPECRFTGFSGRMLIAQTFVVTEAVRQLLGRGSALADIRARAEADGMRSLAETARERLVEGATTVAEVVAVLGSAFWTDLARARELAPPPIAEAALEDPEGESHWQILVIMPDGPMRRAIVEAIREAGCQVIAAATPLEARAMVERGLLPSGVVGDVEGLSVRNVEATVAFRDTLAGGAIPTIALRAADPSLNDPLENREGIILIDRDRDAAQIVQTLFAMLRT